MYNVNPIQLVQMIKNGQNPQQLMISILEQGPAAQNPMYSNLLALAKNGKGNEIETIARNMAKEKGIDYDKEFNNFKQMFGF